MATTTTKPQQRQQTAQQAKPAVSAGQVAVIAPPRLMMPLEYEKEFGITGTEWRVLVEATFPSAKTAAAVGMVLAYCRKRSLDPFKRPVHIVPIYNSVLRKTVETVWPGIAEMRTTAFRTGSYAGMDKPVFGEKRQRKYTGKIRKYNDHGDSFYENVEADLLVPEWCEITVWRFVQHQRVPFPGPRVEFDEIFSRVQHDTPVPNDRWQKAPVQMLEKCAEAAALRRAFPEELGDEFSAEEAEGMAHRAVDITGEGSATVAPPEPQRANYQAKAAEPQPVAKAATTPPTPPKDQGGGEGQAGAAKGPAAGEQPATDGGAPGQPEEGKPPVTDAVDLNEQPDDPPPEHAKPGQKLQFARFAKVSEFCEFADDFLPKTNRLGAMQFESFYDGTLIAMERGKPAAKDAAKEYREKLKAMIGEREPGEEG